MREITTLVSDFGGVISCPRDENLAREIMKILGTGATLGEFSSIYFRYRADYDGGFTDAAVFWGSVAAELGLVPDESRLAEIINLDVKSWFNINSRMINLLHGIRESVGTMVLLSNINYDALKYLRETCAWLEIFDHTVYSCEEKVCKPERRIYEICLERSGAEAGRTLFIDDSEENVAAARACGINSIFFNGVDDFTDKLVDYRFQK